MADIGTIIDGKYEILKKIGQGGMSVVYLAIDNRLNKQWAVKEVRKEGVRDFEMVKQGLMVETNMLKKLSHPNLPRIVDIIETDGTIFVVMDYIEGRPLSSLLNEYGAQSQEYVIEWAKQLCDVLQYLHTRIPPIIYRDMKPANVMLKPDGNLTLIDFGIAREYKEKNLADTTCLGTQGYAAPEQFGGNGQTDARTDIYGLGATIYHLITGHNPCEPPYEIYPIRQWNPALSTGIERIIQKCTQRNPEDRYQSCAELLYALEHYDQIDDLYRRKQYKKLAGFSATSLLCAVGIAVSLLGYNGIVRQRISDYNGIMNEASAYVSVSLGKNEFSTDVINTYKAAIDIDPSRTDAYTKLVDYYSRMGRTQNGVDTLTLMIETNNGSLKKNNEVLMYTARLFFNGNPNDASFNVDYASAAKYFSMVDEKAVPEAKYYNALSVSLSEFSSKIDWSSVIKDLKEFEKYNDSQNINETQIANYLSLTSVYIANKSYIRQAKEDPFTAAVLVIEKVKKSIDFLKEQKITDKYQAEILRRMGDAVYLRATFNNTDKTAASNDYDLAVSNYQELIPLIDSTEGRRELKEIVADIYKAKGEFAVAAQKYQEVMNEYPDDPKSRSSYGLMALVDMNDKAKAVELYKAAKALLTAKNDSNFNTLEQKLKNAGAI